jgi:CRP-like cAMP-binding protein
VQHATIERISKTTLFAGLGAERLTELLARYDCRIARYADQEIIRLRGEEYRELLVVLRGSLEATIDDFDGHVLRVETLPMGSIVASAIFFAERNYLPVTVSAMGSVEVACFSRSTILSLAREDPAIQSALLRDMGNRTVFLAEKLRMAQFASIEEKLAVYLIEQADRLGCQQFTAPHSKRELAELFGVTRPSVSRVFMHLVDEGYISQSGKEVTIHEPEALRKIAENVSD